MTTKTRKRSLAQCRKNIRDFANKHKLVFEDKGEVGFGRDCVGLLAGRGYIDFNPINMGDYREIEEFSDNRLLGIAPPDAYHKHDCIAVLGRGEKAIRQLSDWVDGLKKLDVTIEDYSTGAVGMQAMMTGATGKCIKVNKS